MVVGDGVGEGIGVCVVVAVAGSVVAVALLVGVFWTVGVLVSSLEAGRVVSAAVSELPGGI